MATETKKRKKLRIAVTFRPEKPEKAPEIKQRNLPFDSKEEEQQEQESPPVATDVPLDEVSRSEPAERIRQLARGFKLSFTWIPGMSATVGEDEKSEWLNTNLTQKQRSAASVKKNLYAKHDALTRLSSARGLIKSWFNSRTNPFPEKGVRIFLVESHPDAENVSLADLEKYDAAQVNRFREELTKQIETVFDSAVANLVEHWPEIIEASKKMLEDKFDPADYVTADKIPQCVRCWFEPVNLELSKEWKYLSEGEKQKELAIIRQKYELAVAKQEEFVVTLLLNSLGDLHKSLSGVIDGTQKTIQASTVQKVFNAVDEFRTKTVRYGILKDSQVEAVFREVNKLLRKNAHNEETLPETLRRNRDYRDLFAVEVDKIKTQLGTMLEEGTVRRKLILPKKV